MNLLEFHIKYGYYIDVKKTELGCSVYFPANINIRPQLYEDIIDYELHDDYILYKDVAMRTRELQVDKYVQRFYITTDIVLKMQARELCKDLILISDNENTYESIVSILPEPERKEDKDLEIQLAKIYADIWFNSSDFTSADKLGVKRGYQILVNLIANEGVI